MMLRYTRIGFILLLFLITGFSGLHAQTLFPDVTGSALRDSLVLHYYPADVKSYNTARDTLFARLERPQDDSLTAVYSGLTIKLNPSADPTSDAFSQGINTEHTWPRSLGAQEGTDAHSDLHHLFPTREDVNSQRSNLPFGDVSDLSADRWFCGDDTFTSPPDATQIPRCSILGGGRFEPRDAHKGAVARAMIYFYTMYYNQADLVWFDGQQDVFQTWHEDYPVTQAEVDRSARIAGFQGNDNPFTLDATLVDRLFGTSSGGSGGGGIDPPATVTLWINEIHYDNAGADSEEGIEIAGSAGTDLSGYEVALYNGSTDLTYDTISLSGTLPDQENGFGTLWFARSGIQNGSPDGMALVDRTGQVLAFLSYEGTLTASDGPAVGLTSVDIGVAEESNTSTGMSLQQTGTGNKDSDFTWTGPQTATPGQLNSGQAFVMAVNTEPEPFPTPLGFHLTTPYPNPTTTTATFTLEVAVPHPLHVAVYDVLGRVVHTLHDGLLPPDAVRTFTIDTTTWPTGVYLVRAVSPSGSTTRMMSVVR